MDVSLQTVTNDLEARDAADVAREAAPLRPADDAVLPDTTELNPDQAFTRALEIVRARQGKG